jgi:ABC-type transport system involved in cytochrome bd biosynthesis fused ATPase/permease subunit
MKIFELESIKKRESKDSKELLFEAVKARLYCHIFINVLLVAMLIIIITIESPMIIPLGSILIIFLLLVNLVVIPFINKFVNSAWFDILKNNETYYKKKLSNKTLDEAEKLPDNYEDWRKDWV